MDGISRQAKQLEEEKERLLESLHQSKSTVVGSDCSISKTENSSLQTSDLDLERRHLSVCSNSYREARSGGDSDDHSSMGANDSLKAAWIESQRVIVKLQTQITSLNLEKASISAQAERDRASFKMEVKRLRSDLLHSQQKEQSQSKIIEDDHAVIFELKAALNLKSRSVNFGADETNQAEQSSKIKNMIAFDQMETEKLDRVRFKKQVMDHAMKMVEEIRQRSADEHEVLLKRIHFLTEELEETSALYTRCETVERELLQVKAGASEVENRMIQKVECLSNELALAHQQTATLSDQLYELKKREADIIHLEVAVQQDWQQQLAIAKATSAAHEADMLRAHSLQVSHIMATLEKER